ncbi:MAG TPA: NifU family protein, partial [Geminicoccaceae bacterium]|nr:NifU family protein [Geminicoccaceae bacterium]
MFIQTEQTPNPATLKFLPGREVMARGVADFTAQADAECSPLARRLFEVDGVTGVFFGTDFITVTKAAGQDWYVLKPAVLGAIMEHYMSGDPVLAPEATVEDEGGGDEDDEIVKQIRELIDTRVRPAVAQDGGDIIFRGFERGVVYLH